jgi:hypothetical protein
LNHADGSTMSPLLISGTLATAATTCGDSAGALFGAALFAGSLFAAAGAAAGGSFTGPDGAVLIGPDGALFIGAAGAVLMGPDGAAFAGGGIGVGSLRIPVVVFGGGVTRATGCVGVRGGAGVLPGTGSPVIVAFADGDGASDSGRSSGSGASASRGGVFGGGAPVTAGMPIIVGVDDLALRMTRPLDHNSSV